MIVTFRFCGEYESHTTWKIPMKSNGMINLKNLLQTVSEVEERLRLDAYELAACISSSIIVINSFDFMELPQSVSN